MIMLVDMLSDWRKILMSAVARCILHAWHPVGLEVRILYGCYNILLGL